MGPRRLLHPRRRRQAAPNATAAASAATIAGNRAARQGRRYVWTGGPASADRLDRRIDQEALARRELAGDSCPLRVAGDAIARGPPSVGEDRGCGDLAAVGEDLGVELAGVAVLADVAPAVGYQR